MTKQDQLVFHGSRAGTKFSGAASSGLGDWFGTNNREYASQYGEVQIFRIEIKNPYPMDFAEFREYDRGPEASVRRSREFRKELEAKGYDSIIVDHDGGVKEYILFDAKKAHLQSP